jgi:glycogen operon protein
VTAIELLPIQVFLDDRHLVEIPNYRSYDTAGFFAPAPGPPAAMSSSRS